MKNKQIIVILDNVRSVLNVGAILRTCDGAGVKKLYLCGITPNINHPKISKTALGAEQYVETEHLKDSMHAVEICKKEGYTIVSIEQSTNSVSYLETDFGDKVCFIFGNEITGVSSELLESSDFVAEIPMFGKKNSLNVSTTVGIILYHEISR